ncbi:MAG TPA: 2-dehydropantoate 2-reductase [Acidimicrobiales bacterium]|nr:2-dehydropantoate 2-reductase [Acidimicrobiales bacterium]
MRFVVVGAGAIGGVVGGRLHQAGHDVALVARGAHAEAMVRRGLVLESPSGTVTLPVAVARHPAEVDWGPASVVLLSVKGQDTEVAIGALAANAPPDTPVVCMQNGVENERRVLRRFAGTYAMCVMCPASHLEPGVVQAHSEPVSGLLDVGRYPAGVDGVAVEVADALGTATFDSRAVEDVMRWKYTKLVKNLANIVEPLCGPDRGGSRLVELARLEGRRVLEEAGIAYATDEEDAARRGHLMTIAATASGPHRGGSTWQSVARGSGSVEVDFLNGEIVLLGRLVGVPTPVNTRLTELGHELVERPELAGTVSAHDVEALVRAATR